MAKTRDGINALQHELRGLQGQIAALEAATAEQPDYGLGKGDPAITRWELDQAMLERLKKRAASLERSIEQIDRGTYGTCKQCGKPIDPDRLAVLPGAEFCIRCAQANKS
jgi:DnaK suppressor protein